MPTGKQRSTFRDTLARVADRNATALMRRARVANSLAKQASEGGGRRRARRNAYTAKVLALEALVLRFPNRVRVAVDPMMPLFVVVAVEASRFGLHAPASRFLV